MGLASAWQQFASLVNHRQSGLLGRRWAGTLVVALLSATLLHCMPALGKVVKSSVDVDSPLGVPTTTWADADVPSRGVILALHGLVLHGGAYDAMARQLADRGFVVIAPDMRGYGRWIGTDGKSDHKKRHNHIDYKSSHKDLVKLTEAIKSAYPDLPLYCLGESLGADMALHLTSTCPESFDGMILAAPAVQHRLFISAVIVNTAKVIAMPTRQIELTGYMRKYFSSDPRIGEASAADPLVRKKMSFYELLQSSGEVHKALDYARQVPKNLPVLVMQGSDDQMIRCEAVADLFVALPSGDKAFEWFSDHGHLMLETPFVDSDAMKAMNKWLDVHGQKPAKTVASL